MSVPVTIIIEPPRRNSMNAPALPNVVEVSIDGLGDYPTLEAILDSMDGELGVCEVIEGVTITVTGLLTSANESDRLDAIQAARDQYAEQHTGA